MATTQQMLNACDEVMHDKIDTLLYKFFWKANNGNMPPSKEVFNKYVREYGEIFFKLINMEHKYCRPKEE